MKAKCVEVSFNFQINQGKAKDCLIAQISIIIEFLL